MSFDEQYEALTGYPPLSWQKRLYVQWRNEDFRPVIDLPTGLGKTMVMAIWLIARANGEKLPTRLIYVVDRRTVVDQATDLAEKLAQKAALEWPKLFGDHPPAISTLRGQMADNREWSKDPSHPAIIIGTVDLIGSGLLFTGYRSGFKRHPLEAGLLGQDSLLILDEAHLSKPFEKLLCDIDQDGRFQKYRDGKPCGKPMRVIRMSATSGHADSPKAAFTLEFDENRELTGKDAENPTIKERFKAQKHLFIEKSTKLVDDIATKAVGIATKHPGSRIVLFVKSPSNVDAIQKALIKKEKTYENKIALLTGTMRGLERDELVTPPTHEKQHHRRVMQRFINPDNDPSQGVCFLISTSAGEVGFDLNADHMICDTTTIDSLIQRLGRVNRRGKGDATVVLLSEPAKIEKDGKPKKLEGFDLAIANTLTLLDDAKGESDSLDVSPNKIACLKQTIWNEIPEDEKKKDKPKSLYELACTPDPTTVELTDILLDAWSMTSILEPMPGRPAVGPWLRGIEEDQAQTTIAWRAELDQPGFGQLDLETIEEWFDTHRVLTHESLSVPTSAAIEWFTKRWNNLDDKQKCDVGKESILVDRAGLKLIRVKDFIDELNRKNSDSIRNADLILPASFGGIERGKGLLDLDEPTVAKVEGESSSENHATVSPSHLTAPDVADVNGRYRELVTKPEEGEQVIIPITPGNKPSNLAKLAKFIVELESDNDKRVQLVSYVPKRDKLELGSKPQSLTDHVTSVRNWVDRIIGNLDVNEVVNHAARLAAEYHDYGKDCERWQRLLVFPKNFIKPDEPMAKSGGEMRRDPRGYRHEFGSLREFFDAYAAGKLLDDQRKHITQDVFDLAAHLIATHHGRGRPHFPKGAFDPRCESRSDEIHTESIRRFARLQRTYGWWHLAWLENLLRCADAQASADQEAADDVAVTPPNIAGGAK